MLTSSSKKDYDRGPMFARILTVMLLIWVPSAQILCECALGTSDTIGVRDDGTEAEAALAEHGFEPDVEQEDFESLELYSHSERCDKVPHPSSLVTSDVDCNGAAYTHPDEILRPPCLAASFTTAV